MKKQLEQLSNRFLISLLTLGVLSAAFSYFSMKGYRQRYFASLRNAEGLSQGILETRRGLLSQRIQGKIRSLKRMAEMQFSKEIVSAEKLIESDWLWLKSEKFNWQSDILQNQADLDHYGIPKISANGIKTILDSENGRLVFQYLYQESVETTAATSKAPAPTLIEAGLDISNILNPEFSETYRAGVFFVGPDGSIYPIGGDRSIIDFRPGKKSRTKLAEWKNPSPGLWRDTVRVQNLPLRANTAILGDLDVPGLNGKLMIAMATSVDAGWFAPIITLLFLFGLLFLFFHEKLWEFLPANLDQIFKRNSEDRLLARTSEARTLKTLVPSKISNDDESRERFLEGTLNERTDPKINLWGEDETVQESQDTSTLVPQPPPPLTGVPRLYLQKKANERKNKIFEIDLNIEERQVFLRRLSVEVSEISDLQSLAEFFANTFTRLLGGAPATFFAMDPKDGRVQMLARSPADLFAKVIPAAFLPLDSDDSFERAATRYLKDLGLLGSSFIAQGTEWSVFALGAAKRKAGFWGFPIQLASETRFFIRMLCEVFLGHYLFLKAEETEKQRIFFQGDLLRDRIQEETLQNTRLRHPFSLALIETKLESNEKTELDSLIFGLKADETLKVGKFLSKKVRRSDRVFTIKENQIAIFFPHTALLDLVVKVEKMLAEWNRSSPDSYGLRSILVEFPTHGDTVDALEHVMKLSFEQLRRAQPGQVMIATAPAGYLPPFKSRFIRSAIIPGSPK